MADNLVCRGNFQTLAYNYNTVCKLIIIFRVYTKLPMHIVIGYHFQVFADTFIYVVGLRDIRVAMRTLKGLLVTKVCCCSSSKLTANKEHLLSCYKTTQSSSVSCGAPNERVGSHRQHEGEQIGGQQEKTECWLILLFIFIIFLLFIYIYYLYIFIYYLYLFIIYIYLFIIY